MAFLTFCKRYNDRSINILIKGPFWLSPERVFLVVQCAFMTDVPSLSTPLVKKLLKSLITLFILVKLKM